MKQDVLTLLHETQELVEALVLSTNGPAREQLDETERDDIALDIGMFLRRVELQLQELFTGVRAEWRDGRPRRRSRRKWRLTSEG